MPIKCNGNTELREIARGIDNLAAVIRRIAQAHDVPPTNISHLLFSLDHRYKF